MRTSFPGKNGENPESRTIPAQNPPESEEVENVRFPRVIRNKKTKAEATIYAKSPLIPSTEWSGGFVAGGSHCA
jgi:hypothetical protein